MSRVLVGRGRSIRSAMGGGGSGSFFRADGRGIDGPPPVSASLYGLRPQTALRRTIVSLLRDGSMERNTMTAR